NPRVVSWIDLRRARPSQPLTPGHGESQSRRGRPALPTRRLGAVAPSAHGPGSGTAQPDQLRTGPGDARVGGSPRAFLSTRLPPPEIAHEDVLRDDAIGRDLVGSR